MAGSAIATMVASRTTTNCATQSEGEAGVTVVHPLVVTDVRYG